MRRRSLSMSRFSIFSIARNAMSHHEHWQRQWRSPEGDVALAQAFDDHALLNSLGLHSIVNVPVIRPDGTCFATFNVSGCRDRWTVGEVTFIRLLALLAMRLADRALHALEPDEKPARFLQQLRTSRREMQPAWEPNEQRCAQLLLKIADLSAIARSGQCGFARRYDESSGPPRRQRSSADVAVRSSKYRSAISLRGHAIK